MIYDDLPLITELRRTTPHARHDYKCSVCGTTIKAAAQHIYVVYTDDEALDHKHKLRTARMHFVCPWEEEHP